MTSARQADMAPTRNTTPRNRLNEFGLSEINIIGLLASTRLHLHGGDTPSFKSIDLWPNNQGQAIHGSATSRMEHSCRASKVMSRRTVSAADDSPPPPDDTGPRPRSLRVLIVKQDAKRVWRTMC